MTGAERAAWDQTFAGGGAPSYRFVAYVDNVRQPLADASCNAVPGGVGSCSAQLPPMSIGAHCFAIASVAEANGSETESDRSSPLLLNVTGAAPVDRTSPTATERRTKTVSAENGTPVAGTPVAGTPFVIETVATGLTRPSALAVLPDGRVLIAEDDGVIRMYRDGELLAEPALRLRDVTRDAIVGPVGMAVHPGFQTNQQVVLVFTSEAASGRIERHVVRSRCLDRTLTDVIPLLDDPIDRMPEGVPRPRFGPDRKLYVAFPAREDEGIAADPATYDGKILRLNDDGTTPADNPRYSPIFVAGRRAPGAFDWSPADGVLWIAERDWQERDVLHPAASASAASVFTPTLGPSNAAFYRATDVPEWTGNLLIAGLDGQQIARVQFDRAGRVVGTMRLLTRTVGRISDVVAVVDGGVYLCTYNSDAAASPGADSLLRLVARSRAPR